MAGFQKGVSLEWMIPETRKRAREAIHEALLKPRKPLSQGRPWLPPQALQDWGRSRAAPGRDSMGRLISSAGLRKKSIAQAVRAVSPQNMRKPVE